MRRVRGFCAMNEPYLLRRRLLAWGLVFGIWTLIGLFDAAQVYLQGQLVRSQTPPPQPPDTRTSVPRTPEQPTPEQPTYLWCALVIGVADWYVLAALTPLVYFLARRYSFAPGHRTRDIFLHAIVSSLCALVV